MKLEGEAAGCRMQDGGPLRVYTELSPCRAGRLSSRGLLWKPEDFRGGGGTWKEDFSSSYRDKTPEVEWLSVFEKSEGENKVVRLCLSSAGSFSHG